MESSGATPINKPIFVVGSLFSALRNSPELRWRGDLGARFAAREGKGGEPHHGHFSEHVSGLAFKRFCCCCAFSRTCQQGAYPALPTFVIFVAFPKALRRRYRHRIAGHGGGQIPALARGIGGFNFSRLRLARAFGFQQGSPHLKPPRDPRYERHTVRAGRNCRCTQEGVSLPNLPP